MNSIYHGGNGVVVGQKVSRKYQKRGGKAESVQQISLVGLVV